VVVYLQFDLFMPINSCSCREGNPHPLEVGGIPDYDKKLNIGLLIDIFNIILASIPNDQA
jgi:hypothetical protein